MSARVVRDARELLQLAELTDIVFHEIHGKRVDNTEDDGAFSLNVMTRSEPQLLEIRCHATASGAGGEYVADVSAVFTLSEPVELSPDVTREFAEKVGVMAVYPYVRESMTQSGAKLGLDRPVLPLLRAGDVKLDTPDSTSQANSSDPATA
ncbi:hypothetical protein GS502_01265 [Rhodococcus hoagii]|nr:hypothetical protein [Prescottella equi]